MHEECNNKNPPKRKENRKRNVSSRNTQSSELDRVNHATQAIIKKGQFSPLPNCLDEMGLNDNEIKFWRYIHRLPPWDHPPVSEIANKLEMRKARLLLALERLRAINMIAVEGKGRFRKFHIPHPAYWKHPIPQEVYAFTPQDEKRGEVPPDIGQTRFTDEAVERSKRHKNGPLLYNVGTEKQKFREQTSVQRGNTLLFRHCTDDSQLEDEHQGLEGSLKTYKTNKTLTYKELHNNEDNVNNEVSPIKKGQSIPPPIGWMAIPEDILDKPNALTEVGKFIERSITRGKFKPYIPGTNDFVRNIINNHGTYELENFIAWLPGFIERRIQKQGPFTGSMSWTYILREIWETWVLESNPPIPHA